MSPSDPRREALYAETIGRAVQLHRTGHRGHARALYEGAMALAPDNPDPPQLLGVLAAEEGDHARAVVFFELSLGLNPRQPTTLINLGHAHTEAGRPALALDYYGQALGLVPGDPAALIGRSVAFATLGRLEESLASADEALASAPTSAAALVRRGEALVRLGRLADAVGSFSAATAQDPGHLVAWLSLGSAAFEAGDRVLAREAFAEAARLDPASLPAAVGRLQSVLTPVAQSAQEYAAAGDEFAAALGEFRRWAAECLQPTGVERTGGPQMFYLAYRDEPVEQALDRFGEGLSAQLRHWQSARGIAVRQARPAPGRGSVGIVTSHLREHSVYDVITSGMLTAMEQAGLDIRMYSLSTDADAETSYAAMRAQRCVTGPRSLDGWARIIVGDDNDLLLYPEIGMDDLTLKLAAMRLAPVQAVAWGHPVTTGLPTMDYFLSGAAFEPAGAEQHYSETLVRLPNLGCVLNPGTLISSAAPAQAVHMPSLGISDEGAVFLCPGTPFKYLPATDDVLVEIAARSGPCQIVLFELAQRPELSVQVFERLARAFSARGMDWTRYLRLLPWQPKAAFRSLCQQATAVLDTIGFSGFNTAVHSLQAGAPLVAYAGSRMRGRLGSGTLEYLGLGEWVADSTAAYVDLAVRLAGDAGYAAHARGRIAGAVSGLYGDRSATDALAEFAARALHQARSAR
jgi:protein O-GlcNAc transferase